jgi:hypothetical protein
MLAEQTSVYLQFLFQYPATVQAQVLMYAQCFFFSGIEHLWYVFIILHTNVLLQAWFLYFLIKMFMEFAYPNFNMTCNIPWYHECVNSIVA